MAKITEASPITFSGNFTGVRIKDEKGRYYKMSVGMLMNGLVGKKIAKATPVKRVYRHIEKLDWSDQTLDQATLEAIKMIVNQRGFHFYAVDSGKKAYNKVIKWLGKYEKKN